jgi:muramidase (phage lysozyme)
MNTRITLKVKEGPGELIGLTQLETNNGELIFDKIQFSESGQYVISIISSSNDIENTEFTINVIDQDNFIEQESFDDEEKKLTTENRPYITQIDIPTIELSSMQLETTQNNGDDTRLLESFGRNPFFWYNGVQIQERYILKLDLYYDDIVPKCKVTFIDAIGVVNSDDFMPLSDTRFEIFLNSNSTILKPIHLRFKIETSQRNRNNTNTITGIIDIPDFYKVNFKSYNSTSFDTLREVCREHRLGFNSNIDQTNDQMNWIKNGITTKEFIKNIITHSYISDNSFTQGYIDFYWSLNFIDIEKEWLRDNSNDVAINSTGIASEIKKDDIDKLTPMILSNEKSLDYSGFGFKNYRITNNSTKKNSKKGTYTKTKYYDRLSKRFIEFDIDSLDSDPTRNIILKGVPLDKSELENYRTNYSGKIDIDNVHENYLYAVIHNQRNLNNITNITVELELYELNFNLYKFQKISVVFVNQMQTIIDDAVINMRLTGDWLITDISFIFNGNTTKQKLILARKELSKLIEEINSQVTENDSNTNNSEINNNPVDNNIGVQVSTIRNPILLEPITPSIIFNDANDSLISSVRPILDLIGSIEAPLGYNQIFGNNKTEPLIQMTIDQVFQLQTKMIKERNLPSSAVGRYQFIRKTLESIVKELKIDTKVTKFDAKLQDRLALVLLERRGLSKFLSGKISERTFQINLAKEWASLPIPNGKSFYDKDGLNKALVSSDKLVDTIRLIA